MGVARDAAPEIDRLVLSVNQAVGPKHGPRLLSSAGERGLDSLRLLPHIADFLLAGALTSELATLRMRYSPPDQVLERLEELEQKQLIEPGGGGWIATPPMRQLLEEVVAARAEVAAEAWNEHDDAVTIAARLAQVVGLTATSDHLVAVVHRTLPEPADPYLLLYNRLVTLRYVRQHDHAEAWLNRGLTAPAAVVLTNLWKRKEVEVPSDGLSELIALGFADSDQPTLTAGGRQAREAIETDTNRRAQATFDVLDDQDEASFLDALGALPGTTE